MAPLPGTKKSILSISHRGASKYAPENTHASYNLAWQLGSDAIELDIRETSDKKIVCSHDDDLFRVTGQKKIISKLRYSEIKDLEVGSWKLKKYRDEKIPLLSEVLSNAPKNKKIFIEIKYHLQRVRELIKIIESNIEFKQCHFLCFSPDVIAKLNEKAPTIKATLNLRPDSCNYDLKKIDELIVKSKSHGVSLQIRSLRDVKLLEQIKKLGHFSIAWTVNHKVLIKNLMKTKIDGIITDDPKKVITVLKNI